MQKEDSTPSMTWLENEGQRLRSLGMKELTSQRQHHKALATDNPPRRTGKTTGEILSALGKAMIFPGTNVEVWEKGALSYTGRQYLLKKLVTILDLIRLEKIVIGDQFGKIWIRSENFGYIKDE